MNPWGEIPKTKKYPLGEIQRILGESATFQNFQAQNSQTEDEDLDRKKNHDLIRNALNLVSMNLGICDLKHDLDSIELYSKYENLVSQKSIEKKCETLNNLLSTLNKSMEVHISEDQKELHVDKNNFITVDYENRKSLIETLRFIKKNEHRLDLGKNIGIRSSQELEDTVGYFHIKGRKISLLLEELFEIQNKIQFEHRKIESTSQNRSQH